MANQYSKITINDAKSRFPEFVKIVDDTYVNLTTKCTFIDQEYGEFQAKPSDVIANKAVHKKRRGSRISKSKLHHIDQVKKKFPDFVKILELTYVNTNTQAVFVDEIYGEFKAVPNYVIMHQSGHKERQRLKKVSSISHIISQLPDFVSIDESSYINMFTLATFFDSKYGKFTARPINVLYQKSRHPEACHKNSKGQIELQNYIESLGYFCFRSVRPFNNSNREIDIYIPELKFGIEYNGTYWHSGPEEELKMLNKKLLAEQNGIKMVHIWDNEWIDSPIKVKLTIQKELSR